MGKHASKVPANTLAAGTDALAHKPNLIPYVFILAVVLRQVLMHLIESQPFTTCTADQILGEVKAEAMPDMIFANFQKCLSMCSASTQARPRAQTTRATPAASDLPSTKRGLTSWSARGECGAC